MALGVVGVALRKARSDIEGHLPQWRFRQRETEVSRAHGATKSEKYVAPSACRSQQMFSLGMPLL